MRVFVRRPGFMHVIVAMPMGMVMRASVRTVMCVLVCMLMCVLVRMVVAVALPLADGGVVWRGAGHGGAPCFVVHTAI
ncbi:hypothetical protein ACKI2N_028105 [Cupriavidus sp. 30B13]|uniref:hypothetical protein n=1 Tax=Cupriavidus sp. 30B13 TaxID=3384241 RepID=UPI003B917484